MRRFIAPIALGLMALTADLAPLAAQAPSPAAKPEDVGSVDAIIKTAGGGLETSGFFEREIGRTVEQYGKVVHAFSAYDSRRLAADEKPFARGINSIQLFDDGTRWWITTVLWEQESAANPIPAKFLRP